MDQVWEHQSYTQNTVCVMGWGWAYKSLLSGMYFHQLRIIGITEYAHHNIPPLVINVCNSFRYETHKILNYFVSI